MDGQPRAQTHSIRSDITAGLTTAVMLVPQGMGYAMLAGLPPIYGLYASTLPLVAYAILGTSRQLAVGPVAMDSLLVAASVGTLAEAGTEPFIAYATLLAGMVGVLQLLMGLARLGFLVNFLSRPVLSGFTSAAALIIGLSQLQHLLGYDIPRSDQIHVVLAAAARGLGETHRATLIVGTVSVAGLVLAKKYVPRLPRALVMVTLATLSVYGLGLAQRGVAIVGEVPAGLPEIRLPVLDGEAIGQLFSFSATIALVAFMEAIAVAQKYAAENQYRLDANRELVALGCANLAGSLSQGYPITGGFSRTAVNAQSGATTKLAGVVTAVAVAATLIFLTPLFYFLPKASLAAIIVTAVLGLVDGAEVRRLWRVSRRDLLMLVVTFFATLFVGIQQGILIGVLLSVLSLVYYASRPHIAVLGRLPGTRLYRNIERYPEAVQVPGVLMVRVDSELFFGNVAFVRDALSRLEPDELRAVVLDACGLNAIDSSAEWALREIIESYRSRGIALLFANLKGPVRDVIERAGPGPIVEEETSFTSIGSALAALELDSERTGGLHVV